MKEKKNKTSVTFAHGYGYMELDEFQNAINEFDKYISINPEYYNSWYFRGSCKYALGQYEEAIKDFDKALELDPEEYNSCWNFRGSCKYFLGQYEEAIKDFDKALELINPEDHNSLYFRGLSEFHLGRYEYAACADWKKAAELGSEDAAELLKKHCE